MTEYQKHTLTSQNTNSQDCSDTHNTNHEYYVIININTKKSISERVYSSMQEALYSYYDYKHTNKYTNIAIQHFPSKRILHVYPPPKVHQVHQEPKESQGHHGHQGHKGHQDK